VLDEEGKVIEHDDHVNLRETFSQHARWRIPYSALRWVSTLMITSLGCPVSVPSERIRERDSYSTVRQSPQYVLLPLQTNGKVPLIDSDTQLH
jgi:hypothetical protein